MHVTLCDVGPRDGLQNDRVALEPSVRAQLCDRLAATGLPRIECGSFVNPKVVPQMAGAEEVFAGLQRVDGVVYAALALNGRGVERAVAAGADEVHLAYPLSDTFCARNQNTTLADAAAAHEGMIASAHAAGVRVSVTLGASFGCPFEGPVPEERVLEHVERMAAAGADEIMLADTIGVGVPRQVRSLVPAALRVAGGIPIGLHLHNTRNTGYANADAGIEAGATLFDASIGGLGGCPFAPRATGNIATEDLVYLLDGLGVETGVDLQALISVAEWLAGVLGRDLPGQLYKAGPFVPTG
jgi:isopropylmalate/homocitrate/citramalate synthase